MTPTPSDMESGSASSSLPLRPALKLGDGDEPMSSKSGAKVVSIAEPESLSPPLPPSEESTRIKQFNVGVGSKRLSGRPNMYSNSSSRLSLLSQSSLEETDTSGPTSSNAPKHAGTPQQGQENGNTHGEGKHHHHHHRYGRHHHEKLLSQVAEWLQAEKAKRAARKTKRRDRGEEEESPALKPEDSWASRPRTSSTSSDSSAISLEKLQRILEDNMTAFGQEPLTLGSPTLGPRRPVHTIGRRRSSAKKLGGFVSSDTEYQDGDVVVPSCDVVLDNSKTMSYSGGGANVESSDTTVTLNSSKRAEKERKYWNQFKGEIVRLAHTLRLKGWRRVPLERGSEIEVERLSGALTNAVYVVSPPKELPVSQQPPNANPKPHTPRPPPKLLLRIYGPQVEHLIDRENELGILRRLARKKIGPRLLGTFRNGRFEEFFNAQTLKAEDLRVDDTFKQIAKRMRELHDGIDLLDREREEGPFVWRNWDKWVDRCEEVITYLDGEIISGSKGKGEGWRERGLVCGVEWKFFKAAVDKYRRWLDDYYKARRGVESSLVFAHNDTQYGNILRLIPPPPPTPTEDGTLPPPSPLLLPQNHHKQLIVIDFEYASANTPGLEFANHFTEWCYNYHDPVTPWACHTNRYPHLDQQRRFIRSYVNHRPQFNPRASATPKLLPMDGTTVGMRSGVGEFLLDSRAPGGGGSSSSLSQKGDEYMPYYSARPPSSLGSVSSLNLKDESAFFVEEEKKREKEAERQVQALLEETRIWRVANSAQWVAWGIVQAKVPELDGVTPSNSPEEELPNGEQGDGDKRPEGLVAEALRTNGDVGDARMEQRENGDANGEDEFDYLGYARDRARFFWGDLVGLGLVKKEELPVRLREGLKIVEF